MKIGIDLIPLRNDPRKRGISNFVWYLINNILRLDSNNNEYWFFNASNDDFLTDDHTLRFFSDNINPELSKNLDVYLYTNLFDLQNKYLHPSQIRCKKCAIVYDLIPLLFYDNYINHFDEINKLHYFERLEMISHFDRILTMSDSAKHDLNKVLKYPLSKIDVIHSGISKKIANLNFESSKLSGFEFNWLFDNKYIYSIPSMDARKNIKGMIRAFSCLSDNIKAQYRLVITCELTPEFEKDLQIFIKGLNLNDRIILTNYLEDESLAVLLKNASLFLFPSFYEGFGLPVLEAFSVGVPVVTSNNSSLKEISHGVAKLVDPSDKYDIANAIELILTDEKLQQKMIKLGYNRCNNFNWEKTANLAINSLLNTSPQIGIVSTWGIRCGIAEYTRYLVDNMSECNLLIFSSNETQTSTLLTPNVINCWDKYYDNLDRLYKTIIRRKIDILNIQFNFGLFNLDSLSLLIKKLKLNSIKVFVTFHSTSDVDMNGRKISLKNAKEALKLLDGMLVHTKSDIRYLSEIGFTDNVVYLPQGFNIFNYNHDIEEKKSDDYSLAISSFGFLLPHKGILETIHALSILKNKFPQIHYHIVCSLYPDPSSDAYLEKCKSAVKKLGLMRAVSFYTDFRDYEDVMDILCSSDLIVLPYHYSSESSSASIRFALSSRKPVIVTRTPIFEEFTHEVYKIDECEKQQIADAIEKILDDEEFSNNLVGHAMKTVNSASWDKVSKNFLDILFN